ncbi:MAG: hypothetical protein CMM61_13545 [Rhodospirillaceae bacterium]|nr:hypothetical protein [Rhodospirillaceae bacterium]
MSRTALIAKVHIAKKDLGLDDDTYRDVLETVTGKTSCRDIDAAGLSAVLDHFAARGWAPGKVAGADKRRQNFRARSTKKYVRLIYVYWRLLTEAGVTNKAGLDAFVKRQTKVDSVEWLSAAQGNQVIEALKEMARRAGVSLER